VARSLYLGFSNCCASVLSLEDKKIELFSHLLQEMRHVMRYCVGSMPQESTPFEQSALEPSIESAPQERRVGRGSVRARKRAQLEMAENCQTEPSWLVWASRLPDADILKGVARNPNTPKKELFRLWEMFPETVTENPILTLWEFTSSKPVSSVIPKSVLFSLYQEFLLRRDLAIPDALIPTEWRIYFLKSDDFCPKIALHYFVRDPNERVRLYLLQNALKVSFKECGSAKFPLESVEELLLAASPAILLAFACAVAKKWLVVETDTTDFLEKTARYLHALGLDEMLEHLSCWEVLPTDLIEDLARCDKPAILTNLVALPRCTRAMQERLARHTFPEVRAAVARYTTYAELHEFFAADPNSQVRAGLAASPCLSDDMQLSLITPKNADVHLALMKNPRVLPEVLAFLARLPYTAMKNQLIAHPLLPQDVFDELMADTKLHGISQERVASEPRLLTARNYRLHKHCFELCILIAYAQRQRTPLDILVELACHRDSGVRKAIFERLGRRSPRREYLISDHAAIAIIEAALQHPDTHDDHPLLASGRMSAEQAWRIFQNPRFGAVIRFSAVLNKLAFFRSCGAFADYAEFYRQIAHPLEAMVPHLPATALRPLTNHSETPTQIREIIKKTTDGNIRSSNFVQSYTIPLSAIIDAYPDAFPSTGQTRLTATPHQILQKLATTPHFLLAHYAERCLASPPEKWAKLVGSYPFA